jgi:ferredoxin
LTVERLKETVLEVLKDVELIIGYGMGFDAHHATPLFVSKREDVDRLIWNPLCVHNLTTYLPSLKRRKVGVIVKGCDSRTIIQFLQEGLIIRENVTIIGIPCTGIISVKRVLKEIEDEPVEEVSLNNDSLTAKTSNGQKVIKIEDVWPDKCMTCRYPTPLIYDHLIGEPISFDRGVGLPVDIKEIEDKSLEERLSYWQKEFSRCIRCYACRNACPMCVCQDSCIAESRDPHWISQKSSLNEKFMFHMIHALHLAGRCVECGECVRACPMDIPVNTLKKKINLDMKELFGYEPGVNIDDKPPMYTFNVDEAKIKEHKI